MKTIKVTLFIHTLIYLKPIQVYYRIYYFAVNNCVRSLGNSHVVSPHVPINWENSIINTCTYSIEKGSFTFLNIEHRFMNEINWNERGYGKLWTYNLNYFDFLNQNDMTKQVGYKLILDYIKSYHAVTDGKEPYPISLRCLNWVKFLAKNRINNVNINRFLYNGYRRLEKNLEYHLLGNHLLENAFSLLFGAYYFQNSGLYQKAKKILVAELDEQILKDGAHFELSPMYHQIILSRVLDCIQLIKLNNWKNDDLLELLTVCSANMLAWLDNITFNNGDIPMVNDSAFNIAPSSEDLLEYGNALGINIGGLRLSDSGYRMFKNKKYELFIDMCDIKASYQPGHTHSDIFNFILYYYGSPFIVDTGTSTYEKNEIRQMERSTSSHNTITIGNHEQTKVWGGFRVAKRAKILSLIESENVFASSHDGYKNIGHIHKRKFIKTNETIKIYDELGKLGVNERVAHIHFHPSIKIRSIKEAVVLFKNLDIEISFKGENICITKESYNFACGFNKTEEAIKLKVGFSLNLETVIKL